VARRHVAGSLDGHRAEVRGGVQSNTARDFAVGDLEILSLGINWWLSRREQVSVNYRQISLDRIGMQGDSSGLNARLLLMLD